MFSKCSDLTPNQGWRLLLQLFEPKLNHIAGRVSRTVTWRKSAAVVSCISKTHKIKSVKWHTKSWKCVKWHTAWPSKCCVIHTLKHQGETSANASHFSCCPSVCLRGQKEKETESNQATERRSGICANNKNMIEEEVRLKGKVRKKEQQWGRERKAAAVDFNQTQNFHSGRQPTGMYSCFSYVMGCLLCPKPPLPISIFISFNLSLTCPLFSQRL